LFHVEQFDIQSQFARKLLMAPSDARNTATHAPRTTNEIHTQTKSFFMRAMSTMRRPG